MFFLHIYHVNRDRGHDGHKRNYFINAKFLTSFVINASKEEKGDADEAQEV